MPNDISQTLPDNVIDFLSDVAAVDFAEAFVKSYGLADDQVSDVMSLAEEVVYGDVPPEKIPEELTIRFGLDISQAKQAAIELAEKRLLPIREVLPGIENQIRAWGGEIAVESKEDVGIFTPQTFVQTRLQDIVKEIPAHLRARLAHIFELYVSKHSDRALTVDMLTRSEKVGGVEFDQKDAEELVDYIDEKMQGIQIQTEEAIGKKTEMSVPKNEPSTKADSTIELAPDLVLPSKSIPDQKIATAVPATATSSKQSSKSAVMDIGLSKEHAEDEQEIASIQAVKQAAMEAPVKVSGTIEEMVGQICSLDPMKFDDPKLSERCKQIIDARLREVKTASDTQSQLERSVETGGLGVTGRKLADMMQVIESAFDTLMKQAQEKIAAEKAQFLKEQAEKEAEKKLLAEKEEKILTKRYVELTGKMPDEHIAPASSMNARASAAVSKDLALEKRAQQIDVNKVRSVIEAAKQEPPKSAITSRASVQDVAFVKRLSGPIDELRAMTLIDFRRVSKDPKTAAQKMIDQVRLVEDQGYEKRVEAIRAWQSSPLYNQYLGLARKAVQEGASLESVRSKEEGKGEGLTKEELAAILSLNNEMQF